MGEKGILGYLKRGKFEKIAASLHPGCHQGPNTTALNRYPEIFVAAAAAVPHAHRVLSFGCSTGEECISLASYFPKAQIVGADINPVIVLKAMKKHRSDRIRFIYASDHILKRCGRFDAVFCMSVLRMPEPAHLSGQYPFERFQERALFLESLVKPGGILVIHNSSYRFSDTAHHSRYEKIPVDAEYDEGVFLPDGVTKVEPDLCLFRKVDS